MDFFEDEVVRQGYDWKTVLNKFLFEGKEPLINSVLADRMISLAQTVVRSIADDAQWAIP